MDKKLYLVAELDENTQKTIKELEQVIIENGFVGQQTKGIPYHITLCSYFLDQENYLKDILERIKNDFKEIPITFSSLGLFGLKVLFLNPNVNKELAEMYNHVKGKSLQKDEDLSAHTTLLIDEPENIMEILPKITEKIKKITGKIKYVSLYEFFPERRIKRIELDG